MKEYFALQARMTSRWFKDAGIHPLIGYLLSLLVFAGVSAYVFYKTRYAVYVYPLLALSLIGKLSEIRRNDFLKLYFPKKRLAQLRITENLLALLPFVLFLFYKQQFLIAVLLLPGAILLALTNFRTTFQTVIPTPFRKRPFEFIIGFRNSFYLLLAAYLLAGVSVSVNNFNLGLFAVTLIFFIFLFYYVKRKMNFMSGHITSMERNF